MVPMSRACRPMGTLRHRLRIVLTVFGAVVVALAVAEGSLRVLGHLYRRPIDLAHGGGGSRASFAGGDYTILCIGDSWTHGLSQVPWPEALATRLEAEGTGTGFHVLNAGIPGNNSSQALHRLERLLERGRVDMVIVFIGNNDHQNLAESEYWRFDGRGRAWTSLLAARSRAVLHDSRLYKVARNAARHCAGESTLDTYFLAQEPVSLNVPTRATSVDREIHRKQLEYNLTRIIDVTRKHDAELLLQTYFYFHGFAVNESILDVAATHSILAVNNTMLFHERIPVRRRPLYYARAHPTTLGHAFIADNVMDALRSRPGILRSRPAVS